MKFVDRITARSRLRLLDSTMRTVTQDAHVLRATARGDKARTLYGIGKRDEAAAVCDVILETYASHPSREVYRELRSRCAGANDLSVREHVAQGWFNEAGTLAELGRTADAIAAFSGLITHFGGDEDPEVQEQVAMALHNRLHVLGLFGRMDDWEITNVEFQRRFARAG